MPNLFSYFDEIGNKVLISLIIIAVVIGLVFLLRYEHKAKNTDGAHQPQKRGNFFQRIVDRVRTFVDSTIRTIARVYRWFSLGFAWYAGADLGVLRTMPTSVREKRAAFGYVMFIVIYVSSALALNVWTDILGSALKGLFVGVTWFLLLSGIDRAIMVFMDHDPIRTMEKRVTIMVVRLFLVLGISYVNATIIQMKIFDPEIKEVIAQKTYGNIQHVRDSIAPLVETYETEIAENELAIMKKQSEYQSWVEKNQTEQIAFRDSIRHREDLYVKEIEGLVGSGKKGDGPAAKAKRESILQDSIRLASMKEEFEQNKQTSPQWNAILLATSHRDTRNAELNRQIAKLQDVENAQITKIAAIKDDGFSHRYEALQIVAKRSFFVYAWLLLFIVIEALPIILKMMMGKDVYEEAIHAEAAQVKAEKIQASQLAIETMTEDFEKQTGTLKKNRAEAQMGSMTSIVAAEKKFFDELEARNERFAAHLRSIDSAFSGNSNDDEIKEKIKKEAYASYRMKAV